MRLGRWVVAKQAFAKSLKGIWIVVARCAGFVLRVCEGEEWSCGDEDWSEGAREGEWCELEQVS